MCNCNIMWYLHRTFVKLLSCLLGRMRILRFINQSCSNWQFQAIQNMLALVIWLQSTYSVTILRFNRKQRIQDIGIPALNTMIICSDQLMYGFKMNCSLVNRVFHFIFTFLRMSRRKLASRMLAFQNYFVLLNGMCDSTQKIRTLKLLSFEQNTLATYIVLQKPW